MKNPIFVGNVKKMKIHREGHRILLILLISLFIINLSYYSFLKKEDWVSWLVSGLSFCFFLMIMHFFRKPERIVEKNSNKIYSPADGTIVAIEEVEENSFFKETRLQVSIFMSPLNMHMNLFPLSGVVDFVKHERGKHWVAWIPKSSKENERTSVVIRHENETQIMVRQIAGAVARRIVTYCQTGARVMQGDELGFIKFGSRVDLFLPVDMELKVKLDQKVHANKTLIASFKSEAFEID